MMYTTHTANTGVHGGYSCVCVHVFSVFCAVMKSVGYDRDLQ